MPTLPIPINYGPNKDIEEIGLSTHGAAAIDVYFDSNGNVVRRPALVDFADTGVAYGVDGLYWWDRQEKVIVVTGGRVFPITDSLGTVGTEITGAAFESGNPVYWGDFGTALYGANGGQIIKIGTGTSAAVIADADAPTTVSHITVLDDYLLALSTGTQQMHYANASDPDTWDGSWVSALAKPDLLKSLGANNDIIELLGTEILEGWRNDGNTPFVKEPQYTVNRGTVAPYSMTYVEDKWYFLDQERKVVRLNGRTPEVISLTMNKYIQGFTTVSDAIGQRTTFDGRPQYILIFPIEGKALAYDVYNGVWAELGNWNSTTSSYDRFRGQSFCIATKWNLALAGDRATGKVYKLSTDNYQDGGATLRSMIRTPHVHWDQPGMRKRSTRLDFYLKKSSVAQASDSAQLIVKWRDNGNTTWGTERTVSLGRVGKTDFHGHLWRMGQYFSRQYEFALSDNSPLVLSKVLETFTVLGPQE